MHLSCFVALRTVALVPDCKSGSSNRSHCTAAGDIRGLLHYADHYSTCNENCGPLSVHQSGLRLHECSQGNMIPCSLPQLPNINDLGAISPASSVVGLSEAQFVDACSHLPSGDQLPKNCVLP